MNLPLGGMVPLEPPAGLSHPFTAGSGIFAANPAAVPADPPIGGPGGGTVSPTAAIRALPGLGAWSLDCRRKTLRGVLRAWLLNSRKSVR